MYRHLSTLTLGSALAAALGIAAPLSVQAFHLPAPCDKITASGTVTTESGSTASFAVTGGCKNGKWWGSVSYADPASGIQISSTEISGYAWDPAAPQGRDICGLAVDANGDDVFFRVHLADFGEPGKNDVFGIAIDNPETAGERFYTLTAETLTDGNVQLHRANRSNRPDPAFAELQEWQMCGDLSSPQ
jgi:hypothetical protein